MPYLLCGLALTAIGCSDDEIDSDEQARRAYLAMDNSIQKSIDLGFAGFNAASSANIDPQMATAISKGTLTISGQVDQGNSANKGMRLYVGMVGYDDGPVEYNSDGDTVHIIFDTSTVTSDQPYLSLQLKSIPQVGSTTTGTLEGTLTSNSSMTGVYTLSGDIQGTLTLNLTIAGPIQAGTTAGTAIRVPAMTTVTGTATNSDGGVYNINITI